MGKLVWLLGAMAVFGCDNNRNVAVSNSNPLGTVGGTVLDVNGEAPLANAVITLQTAGTVMMAMSDATGVYSIPKVPAGTFFLTISVTGYESAYVPGTLTGAVGNFPVSNPQVTMPTVELFKTDNTFTVALVDDRGAPVPGVTVTARPQVKFFAYDYPYSGGTAFPTLVPFGQYTVSAVSDAMGIVTFMGLPNAVALNLTNNTQMFIDIPPITIMGATTYQYLGESLPVNPTHVTTPSGTNTFTVQLVGPNTPLSVVFASIDYLIGRTGSTAPNFTNPVGSVLPTDKPISITFNQAVDQKTLRAQLLDEGGVSLGNMTATFAAGNIVQLAAPASALTAGKRYNLVLHADPLSLAGSMGSPLNVTAPFFTAGPATLSVTAALTTLPVTGIAAPTVGKIVLLTFSEAVGLGKGAAATALPCVGWYEGIDLDSNGSVSYQGEWATTLQQCPASVAPLVFDMTKLNSFEPAPSAQIPTTGFATKWWAQIDDSSGAATTGGCKNGVAAPCTKPTTATIMHVIFSHLDSTQTVTRANGQPVGDLMIAIQ